jgi:tetratricopeptide (TPR) repeat protein
VTTEPQKLFEELLRKLQFDAFSRPNSTIWRLNVNSPKHLEVSESSPTKSKFGKSPKKASILLWTLNSCDIIERKGAYSILAADVTLNLRNVIQKMGTDERRFWGPRIQSDYVETDRGSIWCLYEFLQAKRARNGEKRRQETVSNSLRDPSSGMGGFQVQLAVSGGHVSLLTSDHFGMGYLPPAFIQTVLLFTAESYGFRDKTLSILGQDPKFLSIHEWRMPAGILLLRTLLERCEDEEQKKLLFEFWKTLGGSRGVLQTALTHEQSVCRLSLGNGEEIRNLPYEARRIPGEVLESREKSADLHRIDLALSQAKYQQASNILSEYLDQSPDDLFLARRLALLGLTGHRDLVRSIPEHFKRDTDQVGRGIDAEPDNKLLLSDALRMSIRSDGANTGLGILSRLGALLSSQIPSVENLKTFDVVIVELLGDLWQSEDPKKSEECYLRILQKKGEVPRVLRKLIALARKTGSTEGENSYLNRLSKVERRHSELAIINFRLATLKAARPSQREEAIELALCALKLDPSLADAAFLAAEVLVKLDRSDEAIHLLDTRLPKEVSKENKIHLSKNQALIGSIWQTSKSRPDLALSRYEKAVEIDPSNIGAIRALQSLYRNKKDYENLAKTIEMEINQDCGAIDNPRIKSLFDEIVGLFRGPLGNPRKAYDIYLNLVAKDAIDPQEIERVMRWGDIQIDWHDLYYRLISSKSQIPEGERRGRFLCRMAEIAREKLGLISLATQHLKEALEEGWIDSRGFSALAQDLRVSRDFASLAQVFEKRLESLSIPEKVGLIQEYYEIPEGISELRRDQLAVECYQIDRSQEMPILKRFHLYRDHDDVDGIWRLFEITLDIADLNLLQKEKWANLTLGLLADCLDEQRFEVANAVFQKRMDFSHDVIDVLKSAVVFFAYSKNTSFLLPYVKKLINLQVIPDLDPKIVSKVLHGNDLDIAHYERLLAIGTQVAEIAASHARIAAHIFTKKEHLDLAEEMLARVCLLTPCSDADLDELYSMAEKSGNWQRVNQCFEAQIKFEDEKNRKIALMFKLANVCSKKIGAYAQSRSLMQRSLEIGADSFNVKRELVEIAIAEGIPENQKSALGTFLYESQSTRNFEEFSRYSDLLIALGVEKKALQKIIISHLEYVFKKSRYHIVSGLVDLALRHKISHWYVFKIAFLVGIYEDKTAGLSDLWWRGLATVPNLTKAVDFISETLAAAKNGGQITLILDSFQTALRRNAADRLGPRGKKEILLNYASLLFDDDNKRKQSLPLYQEIYSLDPMDSRSWMPLYFVLNEFGSPEDTRAHLEAILPMLIQDPRPLKSFPVNIEFLQEELTRLRQSLIGFSDGTKDESRAYPMPNPQLDDFVPMAFAGESRTPDIPGLPPLPQAIVAESSLNAKNQWDSVQTSPKVNGQSSVSGDPDLNIPSVSLGENFEVQDIQAHQYNEIGTSPDVSVSNLQESGHLGPTTDILGAREIPAIHGQTFESGGAALDLSDFVLTGGSRDEPDLRLIPGPVPNQSVGVESSNSGLAMPPSILTDDIVDKVSSLNRGGDGLSHEKDPKITVFEASEAPLFDIQSPDEKISIEPGLFIYGDPSDQNSPQPVGANNLPKEDLAPISFKISEIPEIAKDSSVGISRSESLQYDPEGEGKGNLSEGEFGFSNANMDTSIVLDDREPKDPVLEGGHKGDELQHLGSSSILQEADAEGTSPLFVGAESQEEPVNWRQAILSGDFNSDLTHRLLGQAFASELEKHIALQCVALVAGNIHLLDEDWHWRVWRNPKEYGYSLNGRERFPRSISSPLLQSSLTKLIIALAPVFIKIYQDKFSFDYLGHRLKTQSRTIEKLRKPLKWEQEFFEKVGIYRFANSLTKQNYKAYSVPGLGVEIFYDGKDKAFYFDEVYYNSRPTSHFFHRFLIIVLMVRSGYFVPLKLHPERDIHGLLTRIRDHLFGSRFAQLTRVLITEKSNLGRLLGKIDSNSLRVYFEKRGVPSVEQIQELLLAMQTHIHQRALAETLDVIGFFESFLDRDFVAHPLGHSEILDLSPKVRPLLNFMTKMKV